MQKLIPPLTLAVALIAALAAAEPVRLRVDFSQPDGEWNMPALALGQGGLQGDPMIEPHIKEIRQLRPRTIRLFLSEYYRIYPDHDTYDWSKLDRELRAVCAAGARPVLALAMKPPVLYPKVDHFIVHPNDYQEWERLCEALSRHCRTAGFGVAAWEVCNEPDIGEWGGTPHYFKKADDYNRFYTHTVTGVRRGDPDAMVGGPVVASSDSFLVEGLIKHCAANEVPLDFLSWHLYSDSPAAHAGNIARQRARLAVYPRLRNAELFISEWNMDLMRPNLAPGFQPGCEWENQRLVDGLPIVVTRFQRKGPALRSRTVRRAAGSRSTRHRRINSQRVLQQGTVDRIGDWPLGFPAVYGGRSSTPRIARDCRSKVRRRSGNRLDLVNDRSRAGP